MQRSEYVKLMERIGGQLEELPKARRFYLMQEWRDIFAAAYHRRTGAWRDGQFDWHVLRMPFVKVLKGIEAKLAYTAESTDEFIVIPESMEFPAFWCRGSEKPDFSGRYADVHVFPRGREWTMSFTHEQDTSQALGPYFARSEWVPRP